MKLFRMRWWRRIFARPAPPAIQPPPVAEPPPDGYFKFRDELIRKALRAESPSAGVGAIFKGICSIGAFSYVGHGSQVASATIGRYCSIAPNTTIGPAEHVVDYFSTHPFASGFPGPFWDSDEHAAIIIPVRKKKPRETTIGNDVWIGQNAVVREGVSIGHGAIVGAGAVVTKDVPPYAIVGGVPAKVIRMRFEQSLVTRFLALNWWEYDLSGLRELGLKTSAAPKALDLLERLVAEGKLDRLTPVVRDIRSPRMASANPGPDDNE